jgi:hypothetical protein
MRQLDAGSLYRQQIETEIAKRLEKTTVRAPAANVCAACAAANDRDARFCKNCGGRLEAAS